MNRSVDDAYRLPLLLTSAVLALVGCAPWLTSPSDRLRVTGVVRGGESGMLEIEAYERCSRRFVFFERCPGKLLGQTKIGKPGPFLFQIDSDSEDVSIVASRGTEGRESVCAAKTVSVDELTKPVELTLAEGPCPLKRASSPVSAGGYTSSGGSGHGGHSH